MRHEMIPLDIHTRQLVEHFRIDPAWNRSDLARGPEIRSNGRISIVCFTNRCGSTLLCSLLSKVGLAGKPNASLNYEFLNFDVAIPDATSKSLHTFDRYLEHVVAEFSTPDGNLTLKASAFQLNLLIELGLIERIRPAPVLIWMRRRNLIAQAISLWTASQDTRWTSLHDVAVSSEPRYDEPAILGAAKSIAEHNALFELIFDYHSLAPLCLWYEDLVEYEALSLQQLEMVYGRKLVAGRSALPVASQRTPTKTSWEDTIRGNGVLSGYRMG